MDCSSDTFVNHLTKSPGNSFLDALPPAYINALHNRGANFLFCDGHAKWLKGPYAPQGSHVEFLDPDSSAQQAFIRN